MKKFLVSMAVVALAAPMFAQNTPGRVAVVDVGKVLSQSNPGKAAFERLKKLQDDRLTKLKSMDDEIKKLESDLSTKRVSLSDDKVAEMTKTVADKKIAAQRLMQDSDREVGAARDAELADLQKKIDPVIDSIGKEMGLALIFNKFESGLVYASEAVEITDTVIKRFNDATGGAAPAKK